jgi:hypothetical protein
MTSRITESEWEFPEKIDWYAENPVRENDALLDVAQDITRAIRKDLKTKDRMEVPGMREVLRMIAQKVRE